MIYYFGALILGFAAIRSLMRKEPPELASMAIIMAIGAFIAGPSAGIPFFDRIFVEIPAVFLAVLWLYIFLPLLYALFTQKAKQHVAHPIASFAVGTWVAGTSIFGVILCERMPEMSAYVAWLAFANLLLFMYYVRLCVNNFRRLFRQGGEKVHGILFLSTVSTQSLVILFNTIWEPSLLHWFNVLFISVGVGFYIISFYLVIKRYIRLSSYDLADDWNNTNCILHGSMSLTGIASVVSESIHPMIVLLMWLWVVSWFVIIGGIELLRASQRVRRYGWGQGLAVYHVSQWARLFTFCTFYLFTAKFALIHTFPTPFLLTVQAMILTIQPWVVAPLFVGEFVLWCKDKLAWERIHPKKAYVSQDAARM